MSAGDIPRTRAAASSIASGTWSSRSQISVIEPSFSVVSMKSARAIRARSTNSSMLSRDTPLGPDSGTTAHACSPRTPSGD